jgi:hypothetical protein
MSARLKDWQRQQSKDEEQRKSAVAQPFQYDAQP